MQQFTEFFLNHWELFLALAIILGLMTGSGLTRRLRGFQELEPLAAVQQMNQGALMLDIRENNEIADGLVTGAIHIPLSTLDSRLDDLKAQQGKPIIIACRSGQRSARADDLLRKQGFDTLFSLRGGILAWQNAKLPLSKTGGKKKKKG